MLVVLRGYPGYQCPLCSIQMAGLMAKAKELSAAGAKVVMVYPGPAEDLKARAEEFTKSKALPEGFYFVIDPDYQFTESYGLRWNAPKETAYPSTFVIAPDGTVKFAQVSKTHAGRAAVKDILAALEQELVSPAYLTGSAIDLWVRPGSPPAGVRATAKWRARPVDRPVDHRSEPILK